MVNPIPVKPQRAANPRLQPLEGQNPRAHSQWPVNHLLPSRWKAGVVLFSLHHLLSTVISSKAHKSPKWKSKHYSLKKKKNKEGKGKTVSGFPGLYYSSLSDQNEFISAIASLVFPIFNNFELKHIALLRGQLDGRHSASNITFMLSFPSWMT